jgi:hypothetical protein
MYDALITDRKTGSNVAFIVGGEVFADAPGKPMIGKMGAGGNFYDLAGNFICRLAGEYIKGLGTLESAAFYKLLGREE